MVQAALNIHISACVYRSCVSVPVSNIIAYDTYGRRIYEWGCIFILGVTYMRGNGFTRFSELAFVSVFFVV